MSFTLYFTYNAMGQNLQNVFGRLAAMGCDDLADFLKEGWAEPDLFPLPCPARPEFRCRAARRAVQRSEVKFGVWELVGDLVTSLNWCWRRRRGRESLWC